MEAFFPFENIFILSSKSITCLCEMYKVIISWAHVPSSPLPHRNHHTLIQSAVEVQTWSSSAWVPILTPPLGNPATWYYFPHLESGHNASHPIMRLLRNKFNLHTQTCTSLHIYIYIYIFDRLFFQNIVSNHICSATYFFFPT